jgi:adenine-specific DNA-methyltransferase
MGELGKGRMDLAMAFILRAARSIRPGGAVSAVLPSPLLESTHGSAWREELARITDVTLIGRFEGYSYFRASMVEPAFIVLRKSDDLHPDRNATAGIDVLVAKPGAEEKSLRSLRHPEVSPPTEGEWSLYHTSREILSPGKWMPRWPESAALAVKLEEGGTPLVGDLFDVRQGALTGHNTAFLLKTADLERLPTAERAYFKPAAGTRTIREGRVDSGSWVFYPYENGQLLIRTEGELVEVVPTFYDLKLRPNQSELRARQGINADQWWALTRARDWQRLGTPKLVSSYFGKQGGFAYDARGEFIVVHGYAWLWKAKQQVEDFDGETVQIEIDLKEDLALAYLAVLNSTVFEETLALACPRVAGTQFNLSKRFVTRVFIPDLTYELIPAHTVAELARLGRGIHDGESPHLTEINRTVAAAYRIDLAFFDAVAKK